MLSTPEQLVKQLEAQAAAILAEGTVLSSFAHTGVLGIEREEPIRRFLRHHLPSKFHVGQGSIASSETILQKQNDIVVADKDCCFLLLNTVSAQLFPIESVHLVVEVKSGLNDLEGLKSNLTSIRGLRPQPGIIQMPDKDNQIASVPGITAPGVHTLVVYQGPKRPETVVGHLKEMNKDVANGDRMVMDFILVLSGEDGITPSSGYLVGYGRKQFPHHYYPRMNEADLDGPKVLHTGGGSFGRWYAAILNHLSGRLVFPPIMFAYLGDRVGFTDWDRYPE